MIPGDDTLGVSGCVGETDGTVGLGTADGEKILCFSIKIASVLVTTQPIA